MPRRRRFAAFTLTKLLVVISVIALLPGILSPALSLAKEQAKGTRYLANLKQISAAMHGVETSLWDMGLSREMDTTWDSQNPEKQHMALFSKEVQ